MEECPRFKTCPFFSDQTINPPRFASLYKIRYCMHDFQSCARYQVGSKIGFNQVPTDLLPGELERVGPLTGA
ncbi:MAG: hypothetical protein AB1439_01890 [candidate division FCPU426 bacterium]